MSLLLQKVDNKAFDLPLGECATGLAPGLIVSMDNVMDKKVEIAWDAEIERRVMEIKSGKAKGRPAEDILAEIQVKYL
ncbi:addiction module protein [bacterium]|nr:addiction module protein [bacterium]MBU1752471.1 addiction module protein [bacterium]